MHSDRQEQAQRVGQDVALAACDLLARVIPRRVERGPPLRAPLAVWLSMMAVVGLASRPAVSRVSTYRAWWMRLSVPSQSHRSRDSQTVLRGGRSFGSAFPWHPVQSPSKTAFRTSRTFTVRGRPPRLAGRISGATSAHSASVRSLG